MEGQRQKVGIVGSGLIGRSWAMLFAGAGFQVKLYDSVSSQIPAALADIAVQMKQLEKDGLLRGSLTAEQQLTLISGAASLAECVAGAVHVQESVPEDVAVKRAVFQQLDRLTDGATVLASSTSCIPPDQFTEQLQHRASCIIAHPTNPPYYVPMVEIVPSTWTEPAVVAATRQLMLTIGQAPVTVRADVPGFASNRIQYAILNECWRLVADGVLSAADVDTVMKCGLGHRYAFMGPLETAHLNAEGMASYCRRYGETIYRVSSTFGPPPRWEGPAAEQMATQLNCMVPLDKIQERRAWRDARLAALAKLKKQME